MTNKQCPICKSTNIESSLNAANDQQERFRCHNCGSFEIPQSQFRIIDGITNNNNLVKHKCAAVVLERNLKGLNDNVQLQYAEKEKGLIFTNTGERIEDFYPTSFYEKLERGFFNLVRVIKFAPWRDFTLENITYDTNSLFFIDAQGSKSNRALDFYCEEGWLKRCEYKIGTILTVTHKITTKGMLYFDSHAVDSPANAFLAMWFGADKDRKYRDAVRLAVLNAGYHLHIVDDEQYNGFIMDKVINLINDSAFVIADVTAAPEVIRDNNVLQGVRGGVYWEAGYATGQKKQVILTCRDDIESGKRIHFDLQQYNQIRWCINDGRVVTTSGQDFTDILTQRILATVGKGQRHNEVNKQTI